ncbi:serine/threonine protein kinase [Roseibium aggregatum]|uniref:Protein kinase n=1 Tax=Roseibium aggregatum TaxID=187304 RepID=A0A939EC04_9HYPH|nr:serine/threonine-protein kinase [Roseibium aggregatum]MBN9670385.1 protein kinase [Roseibium aggregatum]
MNSADHHLPRGTRLNNLYEIEEHIADGGIGTVYRARDVESGDPVAIKVLLASFAKDAMILDLFKREAKILRTFKHDALTQYFVFAKEPTLGIYYLAMEFVSGPSLSQRLESGPLEPEAVYRLLKRLADALQAVHQSDVIHRDLSPDNIILQNADVGQAKIIDFGISKANKSSGPTIIGDGFAGKINYVSPEQVGIFDGKVTARSDIYSLGLVIAEALTGKQIDMGGTQAQIVEKRRHMPPLEGIDNRFRPLLETMLQPDPANRPASMAEIAEWTLGAPMNRRMAAEATVIRPSAPAPEQTALDLPSQPVRWGRRILVALSLLGFAGLGAGGVYFVVGQQVPEQDQKPVLVVPPQENAPTAPVLPATQTPEVEEPPVEDTEPATVPVIPVPEKTDTLDQAGSDGQDGGTVEDGQDPQQDEFNLVNTDGPAEDTPVEEKPEVLKPEDRVRNYVTSYQAGECMYLQPVQIASRSAEIEGFASRTPPFIAFDSDFTKSQGFEAKIQVNLVSDAQCPAVAFLRATPQGSSKTGLTLDMQRTVVPNGDNMAGRISGFDRKTGELGLLFVDSKGGVANLTPYLRSDDGGAGFVVPLNLKTATEETGLIIALVGPDIGAVLASRKEKQARPFFENLMRDVPVVRATATTVKVEP